MKFPKPSETVLRLRRNLLASSSAIIAIIWFEIQICKVTTWGFEFRNLSTNVILIVLGILAIYHAMIYFLAISQVWIELFHEEAESQGEASLGRAYSPDDRYDFDDGSPSTPHHGLWQWLDHKYGRPQRYANSTLAIGFDAVIPALLLVTALISLLYFYFGGASSQQCETEVAYFEFYFSNESTQQGFEL